jgi:hypothetical protein
VKERYEKKPRERMHGEDMIRIGFHADPDHAVYLKVDPDPGFAVTLTMKYSHILSTSIFKVF